MSKTAAAPRALSFVEMFIIISNKTKLDKTERRMHATVFYDKRVNVKI